jgi:ABC-2 type transport system ATP-binding protein
MTAVAHEPAIVQRPASEGVPAVAIDGLRKRFTVPRSWHQVLRAPASPAMRVALDGLSLEVPEGTCFGVLGPNGAGKTTLFRMLAGSVIPDAGAIRVFDVDGLAEPHRLRALLASAVNDERTLLWRLDARANLDVYAALHGLAGAEARRRIAEVLEVTKLADTGRTRVVHFSSGMRQRLLVARALLARPRVLLLDEPTRSLDPIAARELRQFVRRELVDARGCTVLLATHDSEEAFDVCDGVAVLHRGRVLARGAARPLAAEYCAPVWTAWVRSGDASLAADMVRLGLATEASWLDERVDGVRALRLTLPARDDASERAIAWLVSAGARVARFEAASPSLATLIERIVERAPGGGDA